MKQVFRFQSFLEMFLPLSSRFFCAAMAWKRSSYSSRFLSTWFHLQSHFDLSNNQKFYFCQGSLKICYHWWIWLDFPCSCWKKSCSVSSMTSQICRCRERSHLRLSWRNLFLKRCSCSLGGSPRYLNSINSIRFVILYVGVKETFLIMIFFILDKIFIIFSSTCFWDFWSSSNF